MAKRDTRGLILRVALDLFNRHGEPNVSTNQIAIEADISPGNLYYHFRSRDEIALDLFKLFLAEIQPLLSLEAGHIPAADELWLRLHLVFEVMGRYRFIYRHLPDLRRRIPNLGSAFNGLLERQRNGLTGLLQRLDDAGVMNISDLERTALADNLLLAMNSWIPFADTRQDPGLANGEVLARSVSRTLLMVAPYLRSPERESLVRLARDYLR